MHFSISLFDLKKALKATGATVKANAKDATGYILIDADTKGRVVFVTHNGKTAGTHYSDNIEVIEEGKVCVSFGKLHTFINTFVPVDAAGIGVDKVTFKLIKSGISVSFINTFENGKMSKNKITLAKHDVQSMYIPQPFQTPTFAMNAGVIMAALSKVSYAVDPNSSRAFIQGVNISFDEKFIYFAGTNGLKLSEYKINNTGALKKGSFIVPFSFLSALRKVIDSEDHMFVEIKEGNIKVVVGNSTIHGHMIVGEQYPTYAQLFSNFKNFITIDKTILMSTFVPYLNILNKEDNKRLTISIKEGKLCLSSDFSEAEYEADVESNLNFVIDVNGTFLFQTLDAIKDDTVEMKFSDSNGVLIFDSANFHNQQALITPIKRRN